MKIKYIRAKDFMAIVQAEVDFTHSDIIIANGNNGVGKTTMGGMVNKVIKGQLPAKPIRHGATDGFYEIGLEDGTTILYKFDEESPQGTLTLIDSKGKPMGQASGQVLMRKLASLKKPFDLDAFMKITAPKEQAIQLAKLVGANLEEHDASIADAVNERKEAKKSLGELEARVVPYKAELVGKEPAKLDEIATLVGSMMQHNTAIANKRAELTTYEGSKKNWEIKIADLEKQLQEAREQLKYVETQIEGINDWMNNPDNEEYTEEQINTKRASMRTVEQDNEAIKLANAQAELAKQIEGARTRVETAETMVEDAETEKKRELLRYDLPGGMKFTPAGDGLEIGGVPLAQCCQSDIVLVMLDIAFREGGDLKFIAFNAKELDRPKLQKVVDGIHARGWQAYIEVLNQSGEIQGLHMIAETEYFK